MTSTSLSSLIMGLSLHLKILASLLLPGALHISLQALSFLKVIRQQEGQSRPQNSSSVNLLIHIWPFQHTACQKEVLSPAELLLVRKLCMIIPTLPLLLTLEWPDLSDFKGKDWQSKLHQKQHFDSQHRAKLFRPLHPGVKAWMQESQNRATVIGHANTPHCLLVNVNGQTVRRNRQHLSTATLWQLWTQATAIAQIPLRQPSWGMLRGESIKN